MSIWKEEETFLLSSNSKARARAAKSKIDSARTDQALSYLLSFAQNMPIVIVLDGKLGILIDNSFYVSLMRN